MTETEKQVRCWVCRRTVEDIRKEGYSIHEEDEPVIREVGNNWVSLICVICKDIFEAVEVEYDNDQYLKNTLIEMLNSGEIKLKITASDEKEQLKEG